MLRVTPIIRFNLFNFFELTSTFSDNPATFTVKVLFPGFKKELKTMI